MTIEKTGLTTEEAIDRGLRELGVTADQANVIIVQHGSKGLFGFGKKEAIVQISKKDSDSISTKVSYSKEYGKINNLKISEPILKETVESIKEKELAQENAKEVATKFLKEMTQAMGIDTNIKINNIGKNLNIELFGENMGVLIGKRGATLEAIQNIINLVVNKGDFPYVNIIIDIENYRSRRKENLESLAINLSRRVKSTGKSVTLEPMTSSERRIIHYALEKEKYVYTKSKGTDPYRYIVIEPKGIESKSFRN